MKLQEPCPMTEPPAEETTDVPWENSSEGRTSALMPAEDVPEVDPLVEGNAEESSTTDPSGESHEVAEMLAENNVNSENHTKTSETDRQAAEESMRRSERMRRPPARFHYLQLGKPLISFAQTILESFNSVLNSINDSDNSPGIIHI